MKIDTTIVDAYLNSEDMSPFSTSWLYCFDTEQLPDLLFSEPESWERERQIVSFIKGELIAHAMNFVPCNRRVWDALFPQWQEFLTETTLDLIVGYPEPYDAVVKQDPRGKYHVIFDLLQWGKYAEHISVAELSQNLLTHELFHVMTEQYFPELTRVQSKGSYMERLEAIAFNEGFAHLVSYQQRELETVPWTGEQLTEIYTSSCAKMKAALAEKQPQRQLQYIYEADHGAYYCKYAAMCAMIYLGRQWQVGGIFRLKELFCAGYWGFGGKCVRDVC
ncbi:MAG: hypothetical protein IKT58_01595 [Oscillospiraceae bacterium]|nr:hypothetical protein [Oscillospiraceae bacterium]